MPAHHPPEPAMREIIFDTETTGLRPEDGERVIEIGAVELENRFPTGRSFHVYLNPQGRPVHPDALRVHGITDQFLADKPAFSAIAAEFMAFIDGAHLVAHNAGFDIGFINAELARIGLPPIHADRVVDTLQIARRKHPMGPNSLDALCSRYGIDNAHRTRHGALLDAELLAEVYIELNGGKQAALILDVDLQATVTVGGDTEVVISARRQRPAPLPPRIDEAALARHAAFIATLGEAALWKRYGG
jgi:DNA polymerase III subunit epsilon